jgi:hypothetical protein
VPSAQAVTTAPKQRWIAAALGWAGPDTGFLLGERLLRKGRDNTEYSLVEPRKQNRGGKSGKEEPRSGNLQHGRVLAFVQPGEQNDLSVGKFQRVVVDRRLF